MKQKSIVVGKIIIPFGSMPEKHELNTARIFAELGKDVEFIPPIYSKGVFTPDIKIDGCEWEIKVPCGGSKRTIENNYRMAERQSKNIIFDLRRIKIEEKTAINQIMNRYKSQHHKIDKIKIITKNKQIIDIGIKK